MRNRFAIFLFTVVFSIFARDGKAQKPGNPFIRNYTTKEYKAEPQNWGAVQDQRGIMYFANNSAVLEYDGKTWRTIEIPNKTGTRSIAIDSNGTIYLGSARGFGYLRTDKNGCLQYEDLSNKLDTSIHFSQLRQILPTENAVWFKSYEYLFKYENNKLTYYKPETLFGHFFRLGNNYFIFQLKKGLYILKDNAFLPAPFTQNIQPASTSFQYNANTQLIPAGTPDIYLYQPQSAKPLKTLFTDKFFSDSYLYSSAKITDNLFAFGTLSKGISIKDSTGNCHQLINTNAGLQENCIYYMQKTSTNKLWACLDNGISSIDVPFPISFLNKANGLTGTVKAVANNRNNTYVCTLNGLYALKDNEIHSFQSHQNQCWTLLNFVDPVSKDTLLLCGTLYGLFQIKDTNSSSIDDKVYFIHLFQSKRFPSYLIAGRETGITIYQYKNGRWIDTGSIEKWNEAIRQIAEDDDGSLWLGTATNGVIHFFPKYAGFDNHFIHYNSKNGFKMAGCVFPYRFRNEIVFGTEKGLYYFDKKDSKFKPHQFQLLMPNFDKPTQKDTCDILTFCEDKHGNVWCGGQYHTKNTFALAKLQNDGSYNWIYAPFNRIPEMVIETLYVDDNNVAWIGGSEGLYRFDYKTNFNYEQSYNCLIRKVALDKDSVVYWGGWDNDRLKKENFKFDYRHNSMNFEFAAAFFDDEQTTNYQYFLEGYDKTWSDYQLKTEKEYTNLSEGNYTFRVRAVNVYNVTSSEAILHFTILPPWYRSWWAYLLYTLIFAGFVCLLLKLNTRRLIAQKEHLEQIINERTTEIVNQKEEIQSQAEELRVTNEKLVELDRFKEGMTGMIVHDLKNPLNTILSLTKIPELQHTGKQMLNMVLNILDVQKFENAQVKLQPIDFDFHSCLKDALQQTKFLFERKSIKVVNNVKPECAVKADYELIQRVCVNLLSNAIKYTPNNGTVKVSCEQDPENLNNVKFLFSDNGIGIPADKLHLIFDKFTQVEAKNSGSVRSTGLGLTFCKLAIEAHGYKIGAESQINEGSTFWFTLSKGILKKMETEKTITEIEILLNEDFEFSEKEKQFLLPYITKLANFTVYEFSDILQIIEAIDPDNNQHIIFWKQKLLNALKACNEEVFNRLINLN
jgi:signal transduction histidine kinase/ligand-binding sensor domain-containing protein